MDPQVHHVSSLGIVPELFMKIICVLSSSIALRLYTYVSIHLYHTYHSAMLRCVRDTEVSMSIGW